MKYVKMTNYKFNPNFTRVFIISAKKSYAEISGDTIPNGCTEITEDEFNAIVEEHGGQTETGMADTEIGR